MKTADGHVMVEPFVCVSLIGTVGINCFAFREGQLMEGGRDGLSAKQLTPSWVPVGDAEIR
jgi:hypothetical protein